MPRHIWHTNRTVSGVLSPSLGSHEGIPIHYEFAYGFDGLMRAGEKLSLLLRCYVAQIHAHLSLPCVIRLWSYLVDFEKLRTVHVVRLKCCTSVMRRASLLVWFEREKKIFYALLIFNLGWSKIKENFKLVMQNEETFFCRALEVLLLLILLY